MFALIPGIVAISLRTMSSNCCWEILRWERSLRMTYKLALLTVPAVPEDFTPVLDGVPTEAKTCSTSPCERSILVTR